MRRVGRFIFNGLTVLSLLICLATGVMWVRGNNVDHMLVFQSGDMTNEWCPGENRLEYLRYLRDPDDSVDWMWDHRKRWKQGWLLPRAHGRDTTSSFMFEPGITAFTFNIGLPYWFICLVTALAPAAWLAPRLRRKRHPPGLCPNCRYDLRATPDRCPECGHVPARSAEKTG